MSVRTWCCPSPILLADVVLTVAPMRVCGDRGRLGAVCPGYRADLPCLDSASLSQGCYPIRAFKGGCETLNTCVQPSPELTVVSVSITPGTRISPERGEHRSK